MGLRREELWKLRLRDAKKDIALCLKEKCYQPHELERLLATHRERWGFPGTIHVEFFTDYLVKSKLLRRHLFTRKDSSRGVSYSESKTLYAKRDSNEFDVAMGLRARSYFSHLSAASFHGLTELVPRMLYTNLEQSKKPKSSAAELEQEPVDRAFSKPARRTGLAYTDGKFEVVLLAGQNTGRLDVLDIASPLGDVYPVTSIERTLVDCAVRPSQAGGIHEVLGIFESARDKVSVRRLKKILAQLEFVYPYGQAIGFLLERAGYTKSQVAVFESKEFRLNFYLEYGMSETEYSTRWRLHYPKGF